MIIEKKMNIQKRLKLLFGTGAINTRILVTGFSPVEFGKDSGVASTPSLFSPSFSTSAD